MQQLRIRSDLGVGDVGVFFLAWLGLTKKKTLDSMLDKSNHHHHHHHGLSSYTGLWPVYDTCFKSSQKKKICEVLVTTNKKIVCMSSINH